MHFRMSPWQFKAFLQMRAPRLRSQNTGGFWSGGNILQSVWRMKVVVVVRDGRDVCATLTCFMAAWDLHSVWKCTCPISSVRNCLLFTCGLKFLGICSGLIVARQPLPWQQQLVRNRRRVAPLNRNVSQTYELLFVIYPASKKKKNRALDTYLIERRHSSRLVRRDRRHTIQTSSPN